MFWFVFECDVSQLVGNDEYRFSSRIPVHLSVFFDFFEACLYDSDPTAVAVAAAACCGGYLWILLLSMLLILLKSIGQNMAVSGIRVGGLEDTGHVQENRGRLLRGMSRRSAFTTQYYVGTILLEVTNLQTVPARHRSGVPGTTDRYLLVFR